MSSASTIDTTHDESRALRVDAGMAKAWSQTGENCSTAWGNCTHDPNWKKRGICPGVMRRRKRQSIFDRYAPYVLSRWQQGCRDVALLLQEIQAQGYTGQIRTVYRFIQTLKQEVDSLPSLSVLDRVSVRQALCLIVRLRASFQEKELIDLDALCQLSSKLSALYTLVQDGWRRWCGNGKPLVFSLGNSRLPKAGSSNCSDLQQDSNATRRPSLLD